MYSFIQWLVAASFFIDPELDTIKLHINVLNPGVNTLAAIIESLSSQVLNPEFQAAQ